MGLQYDWTNEETASGWLLKFISIADQGVLVKVATILWGIWRARNLLVRENKVIPPNVVMGWASNQVTEWRNARLKFAEAGKIMKTDRTKKECRWRAPSTRELKVNVDASLQTGGRSFAISMVVRDHMGSFIQARTIRRGGEVPVLEAEARGVLEALLWLQEMNLGRKKVTVECDSQLVVTAIVQGINYNLEVGNVLNERREILR